MAFGLLGVYDSLPRYYNKLQRKKSLRINSTIAEYNTSVALAARVVRN